ncbi:MAG: RagB/SusD family nutrient uptake outer membrane protein [Chitinophagaceae bacterium]|jgi:hypothetical protein|nr:RagB/SusD family nutrient uptake outer membrane protein [Chitinophagaceae bacterium]
MKWINKLLMIVAVAGFISCSKQLNLQPTNTNTADVQYSSLVGYKEVLAKVYGSYSLISSQGTGTSDVNFAGLTDPAITDFLRAFWNCQDLSTDEAVCAWNDNSLQSMHNLNWVSTNEYVYAMYARSLFQITVCNEFIRQSTDAMLASRNITGDSATQVRQFRAEARFLRAFQYWVLIDLFGNPPFVTENDPVGKFIPQQIKRDSLFNYIESELLAVQTDLAAPKQNEYGRADEAADWALLARLYLNAEVYTGTQRYTDAVTYASKVINAGYSLMPAYKNLFMSDNNLNNLEQILSIAYDATNSQNYGGTTFLICSAHGTDPNDNAAYGIPGGGWLGNRSTQNLPLLFGSNYSNNPDGRSLFGPGTLAVNNVLDFTQGMDVYKFSNLTSTGQMPYSPNGVLCSTDFPLFRLAEQYLIYTEAVLRGGAGGDVNTATQYINLLRERAYGNTSGDITAGQLTLPFILNERGIELYWEGFRRTDLIRFGDFTSNSYLWPWKGGAATGQGVSSNYNLFPIPAAEITVNPHLQQNPGY